MLRYDVHREVQVVLREQVRQFQLAKEDTALLVNELSQQLQELLQANRELRAENERLRRIY
jgi:regulator of replication initiation timing